MTRIRLIEWLFAAVLVVAFHGAALTAWTWFEPPVSAARVAETEDTAPAQPAAAVTLTVTVIGEEAPAASQPAAVPVAATRSSNEIIVVPTEPAVPSGAGQSTAVIQDGPAIPAFQPTPGLTAPQLPPAAALEPPPVAAVEQPPIEAAAPTPQQRSPLRDPVPKPKAKPDNQPTPSAGNPAVDSAGTESQQTTAAVDTASPRQEDEPVSAAHSAYYRTLLAQIKSARRYPDDARREGKEGTVYLQIVVQRAGRIRSYDIVKSSGFQELDDAAVQTLVRANENLPAFPTEITEPELRFGLPIRFGS